MTMHPPLEIGVDNNDGSASPSLSSFKKPLSPKLNCEPPMVPNAKKVSFSKRVKIKKIRSYKLYSDEEREFIWHSEQEYSEIKKGCIRTLKLMMRPDFQEDNDYCPRGLEVRTRAASAARKEVRTYAAHLVFEEQENQADFGEPNDERIRKAYLEVTVDASRRAHFNALRDEKVVLESQAKQ